MLYTIYIKLYFCCKLLFCKESRHRNHKYYYDKLFCIIKNKNSSDTYGKSKYLNKNCNYYLKIYINLLFTFSQLHIYQILYYNHRKLIFLIFTCHATKQKYTVCLNIYSQLFCFLNSCSFRMANSASASAFLRLNFSICKLMSSSSLSYWFLSNGKAANMLLINFVYKIGLILLHLEPF